MLTQRLGDYLQNDDKFIEDFLTIVGENPGSCDEVWFAGDYGFPPIEKHRESAAKIRQSAEKFRAAGLRVSLQISNTVGHGQYMSARDCSGLVYDGSAVEHMTGPDGSTADYCFCWNGENFRKYIVDMLKEYAKMKPYCVWIDDDLRATNHAPLQQGCFCDACIEKFNTKYGSAFNRKELVEAINFGDISWREKFVEFIRDGLYDFTYLMSKTVCDVSPDSYIGFQYCANGGYTGYGYDFIFDAMRKGSGKNPKSRPGGGAYNDHNPNEQLKKSFFISWQNSMLPDYVTEIRPEIENLPDVVYGKTPAGTCFETSIYLASGANAMSYAMVMNLFDPMQYHAKFFRDFARHRPYWERLVKANENTIQAGARLYLPKTMWKRKLNKDDAPFSWNDEPYLNCTELAFTAIPLAYGADCDDDPIYLLHGDVAAMLTADDVEYLLSKPVLTDGAALHNLIQMGYGDCFGADAVPINTTRLSEKFIPHSVNEGIESKTWSQSFFYTSGHAVKDLDGTSEAFGVYYTDSLNVPKLDMDSQYPYGVANAIVRTGKNAKWAVFGHNPWVTVISYDKRRQLLRAMEYIAGKKRLPAILDSYQQAVLLPRENGAHQTTSVSVLNCTIGKTEELTLRIRNPLGTDFSFMSAATASVKLPFSKDGEDFLVKLPPLEPWTVGTVFCE
ncbi:MAG: hypothetical protein ACOYJX_02295 [Acutalibacteraceae bacterium]|jgi:hypothetical protein